MGEYRAGPSSKSRKEVCVFLPVYARGYRRRWKLTIAACLSGTSRPLNRTVQCCGSGGFLFYVQSALPGWPRFDYDEGSLGPWAIRLYVYIDIPCAHGDGLVPLRGRVPVQAGFSRSLGHSDGYVSLFVPTAQLATGKCIVAHR